MIFKKLTIALIICVFALHLFSANQASSQDSSLNRDRIASSNNKEVSKKYMDFFLSLELPTNVNNFIKIFGRPDDIELPDEYDPSSYGQFFKWNILSQSVDISVLVDSYGQEPDFFGDVYYIEVHAKNEEIDLRLFYGLTLNITKEKDVHASFSRVSNPGMDSYFRFGGFDKKIILFNRYENGLFVYLKFNDKKTLEKVAYSTFQLEWVD